MNNFHFSHKLCYWWEVCKSHVQKQMGEFYSLVIHALWSFLSNSLFLPNNLRAGNIKSNTPPSVLQLSFFWPHSDLLVFCCSVLIIEQNENAILGKEDFWWNIIYKLSFLWFIQFFSLPPLSVKLQNFSEKIDSEFFLFYSSFQIKGF